jgi:hypothetical protein
MRSKLPGTVAAWYLGCYFSPLRSNHELVQRHILPAVLARVIRPSATPALRSLLHDPRREPRKFVGLLHGWREAGSRQYSYSRLAPMSAISNQSSPVGGSELSQQRSSYILVSPRECPYTRITTGAALLSSRRVAIMATPCVHVARPE